MVQCLLSVLNLLLILQSACSQSGNHSSQKVFECRSCLFIVFKIFIKHCLVNIGGGKASAPNLWLTDISPCLPLPPPYQAADESSEEASFYEILPCCARFRCGELIAEGQWHHLVLVMSKGMLKNSMATLYIDGQLINTVKVKSQAEISRTEPLMEILPHTLNPVTVIHYYYCNSHLCTIKGCNFINDLSIDYFFK